MLHLAECVPVWLDALDLYATFHVVEDGEEVWWVVVETRSEDVCGRSLSFGLQRNKSSASNDPTQLVQFKSRPRALNQSSAMSRCG